MRGKNRAVSQLILVILVLGYWFFIWKLERIDYAANPPKIIDDFVDIYPLFGIIIPQMTLVFELFSPRVLRHFIPVIAGWWLAREAIIRFSLSFYDLQDREAAVSLLLRLSGDKIRRGPATQVRQDSLDDIRSVEPLIKIGGPGLIAVDAGDAVVTERNARFLRVLGPGTHRLGRFEAPVSVIDVRPQERTADEVKLITRDGIEITTSVSVSFKVSPGSELPSREQPFPFDHHAVGNVAYSDTNSDDGIKHWDSVPLTVATDQLKALIAEYHLDDFIYSERTSVHFHQLIAGEMEHRTRDILTRFGVQIISARLGLLKLPERVTAEHIDFWRSGWDTQRKIREAEGEARAVEEKELARAQAEAVMIDAFLEGINRARQSGLSVNVREIVALRLIEVLETLALQSQQLVTLPEGLMLILGNLRKQLILNQGGVNPSTHHPMHPQE